ncbi:MAG: hypothetical protein GY938_10490, partial [Ketobacter sp.]|nr:hypothetical protein [Ketobacter sp.]
MNETLILINNEILDGGANDDNDIDFSVFDVSRNRRRARESEEKGGPELTIEQEKRLELQIMTVIDSDHLKNPNRPAAHPDHGTSKLLRKDLETKFQALFDNAMQARHDILKNIAAEQKSDDLCYNDVAAKFAVMNSYIIGKLVEFRVYHALKCYPRMYKCLIAKSDAAILKAIT